jgi:hypothetical protein
MRGVRVTIVVLLWWAALFGWWALLAGAHSALELTAGACAALLASVLVLGLRRARVLQRGTTARRAATVLEIPWKVAREAGLVFGALALHMAGQRRLSSRYRAFDLPAGGDPAPGRRHARAGTDGRWSDRHETGTKA